MQDLVKRCRVYICVCTCVYVCALDVNLALRQAMSRVGLDSEKMSKQFELAVPFTKKRDRGRGRSKDKAKTKGEEVEEVDGSEKTKMAATPVHSASAWDQLSLNHTCQWPMHTLLTPSILSKLVSFYYYYYYYLAKCCKQ